MFISLYVKNTKKQQQPETEKENGRKKGEKVNH